MRFNTICVVYEVVEVDFVVAGKEEADAFLVVADIVACNCVIAGIGEADAVMFVVADFVA